MLTDRPALGYRSPSRHFALIGGEAMDRAAGLSLYSNIALVFVAAGFAAFIGGRPILAGLFTMIGVVLLADAARRTYGTGLRPSNTVLAGMLLLTWIFFGYDLYDRYYLHPKEATQADKINSLNGENQALNAKVQTLTDQNVVFRKKVNSTVTDIEQGNLIKAAFDSCEEFQNWKVQEAQTAKALSDF
jgi:flagellar biosynthesis protein FliP